MKKDIREEVERRVRRLLTKMCSCQRAGCNMLHVCDTDKIVQAALACDVCGDMRPNKEDGTCPGCGSA